METTLPLTVLLLPIVIAGMAVAFMVLLSGERAARWTTFKRAPAKELGYAIDAKGTVTLTPKRYVGGHPDLAAPLPAPFVMLTPEDLAVFPFKGGPLAFRIPWGKVDQLRRLDGAEMAAAASGIRGLAPGALDDVEPAAAFARVRYEDARGWWQNVAFELAPAHADAQWEALEQARGNARGGDAVSKA